MSGIELYLAEKKGHNPKTKTKKYGTFRTSTEVSSRGGWLIQEGAEIGGEQTDEPSPKQLVWFGSDLRGISNPRSS